MHLRIRESAIVSPQTAVSIEKVGDKVCEFCARTSVGRPKRPLHRANVRRPRRHRLSTGLPAIPEHRCVDAPRRQATADGRRSGVPAMFSPRSLLSLTGGCDFVKVDIERL